VEEDPKMLIWDFWVSSTGADLLKYRTDLKSGSMTAFANCTRSEALQIDFKHIQDTCEAYKKYLIAKWHYDKLPPKWINREPPPWYNQ
jgi:hypothetical protein